MSLGCCTSKFMSTIACKAIAANTLTVSGYEYIIVAQYVMLMVISYGYTKDKNTCFNSRNAF